MWSHEGWGPMYGWWFMPIFGLIFMAFFIYILSRIFNRDGYHGPFNQGDSKNNQKQDELLSEIKALRREVEELRKNQNDKEDVT